MSSSGKNRAAAPTVAAPSDPNTGGVPDATLPASSTTPASNSQGAPAPAPAPRAPDADGGPAQAQQPEPGSAANEQLHHIQELRTLLEQALANTGAAPADGGPGAPSAAEAVSTLKRLSSQLAATQGAAGDKKARTAAAGLGGGAAIPHKPQAKPPSIFSMDAPTSAATTQGETFAEGGPPDLDNDRIASLAKHHFSPENAAMIKALLQIKTLSTEAISALNPLVHDEDLQLAGIASLLEPIAEQLATIYAKSEGCMANISNLKIDPDHIKIMYMIELNNKFNPHRQPLSIANIRELMGLEALSNKIAAKGAKPSEDPKGKML